MTWTVQRTFAGELNALDRRLGRPWSIRSLRSCLGIALVYGWMAYFLGWGLGGSGRLGSVRLLADAEQPARLASALCAIVLPLLAIRLGRTLGRLERRAKLKLVRWRRRKPKQYRTRLRLQDFERRYRWVLGVIFGAALVTALIWFRRGDVAAFAILFSWLAIGPVSGIAMARRFSGPAMQGFAALAAGSGSIMGAVLLILAFAGAGVSAFAFAILGVTNVAFAGALGVLADILMGGMLTIGLALAGAGVATVALALAGAGTGIATLTGVATMSRAGLAAFVILMGGATLATLAFREAAVLSAAIGGISALAVAAAVAHNRHGRHGAYAGAIGAIALLTMTAVVLGWGQEPLVIFAVCFFLLLPLVIGLNGWAARAVMQSTLERAAAGARRSPAIGLALVLCWPIGGVFMTVLALILGCGAESYLQAARARSGVLPFDVGPMIGAAVADPFGEGFWLTLILLTSLIPPALFTAALITAGLLTLQPNDYRFRRPLFRLLGMLLVSTAATFVIWVIQATDSLDLAPVFGDLARTGVDAARSTFGAPAAAR